MCAVLVRPDRSTIAEHQFRRWREGGQCSESYGHGEARRRCLGTFERLVEPALAYLDLPPSVIGFDRN